MSTRGLHGSPDPGGSRGTAASQRPPTLRRERQLWRAHPGLLAAVDEVGRGALAGPVSVGVVLLAADTKPAPRGVADSKLLSPQARLKLVPRIRRWALDCAVGHASAAEIDAVGLMAALRIAAGRAVSMLAARPDWILLDGNYDYLSHGPALAVTDDSQHGPAPVWSCTVPVVTVVKGDRTCASIAAASVLAKAERDAMLVELAREHPHYGFEVNKAYATPLHLQALRRHGPSAVHRCSWNLPVSVAPGAPMGDDEQMSIAGVGL